MEKPTTALVAVDMQRGFTGTAHHSGVDGGAAVVEAVRRWVLHAGAHGWPVLWTRDVDPFPVATGDPDRLLDIHDLRRELGDPGTVVEKGPGSGGGMSGSVLDHPGPGGGNIGPLASELLRTAVSHLVDVGLAADVCVAATARDGLRLGFEVTVPRDATAFVHAHPDGDEAALAELREAGARIA